MSCQTVLGKIAIVLFILVGLVTILIIFEFHQNKMFPRQCLRQAFRKSSNWSGPIPSMRALTRRKQGEGDIIHNKNVHNISFYHQTHHCLRKHILRDGVKLPEGLPPRRSWECRRWSGFPPQRLTRSRPGETLEEEAHKSQILSGIFNEFHWHG